MKSYYSSSKQAKPGRSIISDDWTGLTFEYVLSLEYIIN